MVRRDINHFKGGCEDAYASYQGQIQRAGIVGNDEILTKAEWWLWSTLRIVMSDYGFHKSANIGFPHNPQGEPLPLFSYPCIEYLDHLNLSSATVLEFGAGYSTFWWAKRA